MSVIKIVITGGPCGGKSSALEYLRSAFTEKGYRVLLIEETATELIKGGVSPSSCGCEADFQRIRLGLQICKEDFFNEAAKTIRGADALIICDRGILDCRAYMPAERVDNMLADYGLDEKGALARYDAVFHMTTAAKGAAEYYTTANNSARTEPPETAAMLDDRVIDAWSGHKYRRIIDNSTGFAKKLERLKDGITAFLDNRKT